MLRFVRLTGGAIGLILALGIASFDASRSGFFSPTLEGRLILLAWATAWTVLGYAVLPYLTVEPAGWLAREVRDMSSGEFVAAVIGLTLGLLMGLLLGLPLSNLSDPYGWLLPLIVSILFGLGTMGLTVAKRQDLWSAVLSSGILGPSRGSVSTEGLGGAVAYVDTSAVIDGRITDVVASGFLSGTLVVPRFVLGELQHIADDSDQGRRDSRPRDC